MKKIIVLALTLLSFSSFAEVTGIACGGTEPFFSLEIENGKLTYEDSVTNKKSVVNVTGPITATGAGVEQVAIYTSKYTQTTIIAGTCYDGMSEAEYSHHMVYVNGSTVLYGCCTSRNTVRVQL